MKHVTGLIILSILLIAATGCRTTDTAARPAGPGKPSRVRSSEVRGVWIYDPRVLDPERTMADLKRHGFTHIFVRLSSGGAAYYPSRVMPTVPGSRDNARLWAEAARRHGIRMHAWHVCFMMHHAPQSSMKQVISRGEAMMDYKGRVIRPSYRAVVRSPAAASTLEFEKRAMVELATLPGIEGVQFDYIRYPVFTVDYSPAARRRFNAESGRPVKNWPRDVSTGARREEYQAWKTGVVTELVREVSRAVRSANGSTEISAAVWNNPHVGRKEYGQDWPRWVREGYLDFVCPMSYTRDDRSLVQWCEIQKSEVSGRIPIYSGLGMYMLKSPSQLNRQVAIVRKAGMPGFVLYNYDERAARSFLPNLN